MRIGLSTSVIQGGKSGTGAYVLALVRALLPAAHRHEFSLFVLERDLPLFAFARDAMRLVPVSERHRPPERDILWHQVELPRLARRLALDVLHVPGHRRMLWRRPCALVATIHDLAPWQDARRWGWRRMFYRRVVVRHLAWRQDEIVAVSTANAAAITRCLGIPAGRITVVPNGLDHARFHAEDAGEARARMAKSHGVLSPFFLHVARLEHPAKNHARLIAAFNAFKTATPSPWQLVLAGAPWRGADVIRDLVRRSPFAQDIKCTGHVAPAELPDLYRAASVLVYPTIYDGLGLPPLEAMACGCAVLAADQPALRDVCGEAAATVNPHDTGDLTRQLARLAHDSALRTRLRAAGLARARQFDWRTTANGMLDVYARAAAKVRTSILAPTPHLAH
jgi:glycosyltransferase involved in cell wall biosynthesis